MLSSFRGLSWQVTAVFGLAILALAMQLSATGQDIGRDRALARAAGLPEPVSLAEFSRAADVHAAGEVHVIASIDPTEVITVTERGTTASAGSSTNTRRLYVLHDPADQGDVPPARAAILLADEQVGRFLALLSEVQVRTTKTGPVVQLNGTREVAPHLVAPALAALRELGLNPVPEFIFLMPYLQGRDAALADRAQSWRLMVGILSGAGAALLVLAIAKRMRRLTSAAGLREEG